MTGEPRIIRRRRGPFKRSRTGCGTCKRRGKKCDEIWNVDGFCQRCLAGPWECTGRSPGPTRSDAGAQVGYGLLAPMGLASVNGDAALQTGHATQAGVDCTNSLSSSPQPATNSNTIPDEGYLSLWGEMARAPRLPLNPFGSAVLTEGPPGSGSHAPHSHAPHNHAPHSHPPHSHPPQTTEQAFWDEIGANWSNVLDPASRVFNSDKPMRWGVSLAEIYARVVESWLVGLPGPTRDYARTRILALHDSNTVIRGVRYAVAAAYIFLFARNPHSDPKADRQPKPKLIEMACRGAGVLQSTRPEPGSGAIKKLRYYVENVSTPFASDVESTKWTLDAVAELRLRGAAVTDRQQLSDLLWGVVDLQLVEFIRGGAAPSYAMLALGDKLVRNVFGLGPSITLSDLRTSQTFSLRLYALSDLSRCIVERGRRTVFRFNTKPAPLSSQDTWSTYLGLPDAIVILLAEMTNLCADAVPPTSSAAQNLESALRAWTPTPSPGVDASALISRTITGELWRFSALVLLYQSVHRVGPLHPVLRQARTELLSLLASVTQLPNGDLWGFIALPAFLAATLCVDQVDRDRAMTFLVQVGPERVWLDNIALVEKVWEEMDETGCAVDWHDKMVREGLSVAFF